MYKDATPVHSLTAHLNMLQNKSFTVGYMHSAII